VLWALHRSQLLSNAFPYDDKKRRAPIVALDLSRVHLLHLGKLGCEIILMGDVLQRLGDEFINRVSENSAKRLVGPQPSEVGAKVCNADRRVLERSPEPRFVSRKGGLGAGAAVRGRVRRACGVIGRLAESAGTPSGVWPLAMPAARFDQFRAGGG
jgi:hypothetical protein